MTEIKQINLYGLKLTSFDDHELELYLDNCIRQNIQQVCYGYSFATIPLFKKYPGFYQAVNNFDVLVCDGRLFYLFANIFGSKLKSDLSIPGMVYLALNLAAKKKYKVLLLGSTDETNEKASKNINEKFPGIQVLEGFNGYFDKSEENKLVENINLKNPDILLIGMSFPKKEFFAHERRDQLNAKIIIPCGGMIDVLGGKVKLTPKWIKKIGLATPYRVFQEPGRLFWINVWFTYETFFKIIPLTFFNVKIKRNKAFRIPGIYGEE